MAQTSEAFVRALVSDNRDRGMPHGIPPPTPPGKRITYQGGSVGWFSSIVFSMYYFRWSEWTASLLRRRTLPPSRGYHSETPSVLLPTAP